MSSAVSWFLFLLFVSVIISHFAVYVNIFYTIGYQWAIYVLRLKTKKACNLITFAESVYHLSENEYISLLDDYIINAEHCISSNRRKIHSDERWYTAQRADEIHAEAWWYAKPAVWIKKVVSKWYDFFGAPKGRMYEPDFFEKAESICLSVSVIVSIRVFITSFWSL